jgi:hypothetical protein
LALTESVTDPEPDRPGPTPIQPAPLEVVHAHPAEVVTAIVAEPPAAGKLADAGETEKVHVAPDVDPMKLATVATLFLSARALSCDAVPVKSPV